MSEQLRTLVRAFAHKRILILGDVMLDEYLWGEVRRISPEAPVPVVELRRRTYLPGGAANTAANVLSLEGKALLGGVVGRDHQAGALREKLLQLGADADGLVEDPERVTTTKTRILAHHQQVTRVDVEQSTPLAIEREDALLAWAARNLPRADACILSDYAKGVVSPRLAAQFIALARQAGKPVIVDPKGIHLAKYRGATLIKPNSHEAERFCKIEMTEEAQVLEAGRLLQHALPGTAILITRGAEGMSLFLDQAAPLHVSSVARDVFDVTGAGDTVASVLALALAAAASIPQAAMVANHAAGIVVGKVGTSTVSTSELLAALPVNGS
jgi:D-beta-D-heptose 7-phosphate kinase/D-beta-D-heptose 1-phosphate adenosyltransferase